MVIEKFKWALRLFKSHTFLVLTDKASVVNIPLAHIDSFENQFLLSAQTASLVEFKSRLEDLISEHEQAIKLLAHRQSQKRKAQAETARRRQVRKTTKKG